MTRRQSGIFGNSDEIGPTSLPAAASAPAEANPAGVAGFDEAVIANIGEGLYTTDEDGLLLTINPAGEKILGWAAAELRGRRMHELVHHTSPGGSPIPPNGCRILNVLTTGCPALDVDDEFIRKDGTFVEVCYTATPLVDCGRRTGIVVVFRDVSERRQIEARVRESEARLRAMFGQAGVGVCLLGVDLRFEQVNPKFCEITGYTPGEICGLLYVDTAHSDDRRSCARNLEKLLQPDTENIGFEKRILHKGGAAVWVRVNLTKILGRSGEVKQVVAVVEDISERRRAEERLRQTEHRFALFMQHLPGLAWIKDADGRYLYANEAAKKAFGASDAELYGKTDADVFPADVAQAFAKNDAAALGSEAGIQVIETLECEGLGQVESLVSKFAIPDIEGRSLIGGMAIDVTDRRRAQRDQEFLFAIAEMIRTAAQPAELLKIISRLIGEYLHVHRCLFNEIDLDTDTEIVHTDYARTGGSVAGIHRISDYSRTMSEMMMSGKTIVNRDSRIDPRTADLYDSVYGPSCERSYVAVPMLRNGRWVASLWCSDDQPRDWPVREIALLENIAERTWAAVERLRTEAALLTSEDNFRSLFESIDEGFVIVDLIFDADDRPLDYRFVRANPSFTALTGLPQDAVGRTAREVIPDLEEFWFETYGRVALTGESVRFEREAVALERWFDVYASRVGGSESRQVAIVFSDITERKRVESALRESEERFQLAQSAGNVGVWDWDIALNKTYWSDTMWGFYGEEPTSVNPDDEFWSSHLHPEDRKRVKEHLAAATASGDLHYRDEFRIIGAGGRLVWIASMANIVRRPGGEPIRMYGVNVDVTDRKLNEERIKRNEAQLKLVTDSVPALIAYVDADQRYQFANRTYSEWFGHEPEAVIGKTVKEVIGSRAYAPLTPLIDKVLTGEKVLIQSEIPYERTGPKFVQVSYVPDVDDSGTVRGYFSLISDLTETRRSQELLRSTEQKMALLMENVTDYAILSINTDGVVESWNTGAERIFGYAPEEIIGRSAEVLFTPEDVARGIPLNEMRTARQKGRANDERWHVKKDGSRFFASGVMMPLIVGKRLTGYAKIASDLTEKKKRAEQLQTAHDELELRVFQRTRELADTNELLRTEVEQRKLSERQRVKLLHRIVSAQEAERKRIARDIHDQLGQRLTALRLKLASLHGMIEDEATAARVERLQEIASLLDGEVSFLASELRPSTLDDLGLEEALRTYARDWSQHFDIKLDFHSNGVLGRRFRREVETQLYRIAQEALNNVAKHSAATAVTVMMEKTSESLILIVEDNGTGFEERPSATKKESKGLGLVGMKERATLIGADLEIESSPGSGTTVFLRLPDRKRMRRND